MPVKIETQHDVDSLRRLAAKMRSIAVAYDNIATEMEEDGSTTTVGVPNWKSFEKAIDVVIDHTKLAEAAWEKAQVPQLLPESEREQAGRPAKKRAKRKS